MLDKDYSRQLDALKQGIQWAIELPPSLQRFFDCSGEMPIAPNEERRFQRIRARTEAVGYIDIPVSSIGRDKMPFGAYTCDFSRSGCSFLTSFQLYPNEELRLILSKFWLQLRVVRCRRLGPNCYESGSVLISRNPANDLAFDGLVCHTLAN
jgi:hypothetical protein